MKNRRLTGTVAVEPAEIIISEPQYAPQVSRFHTRQSRRLIPVGDKKIQCSRKPDRRILSGLVD